MNQKLKKIADEFENKISPLLNPTGAETPSQVASHLSKLASTHKDVLKVKGSLFYYLQYHGHYVERWWEGLRFAYEGTAEKKLDLVIKHYIKRANLSEEERAQLKLLR